MQFSLPRIYPITDAKFSGLTHAEQVRRFAESGADLVQIREKAMSSRDLLDAVVESLKTARPLGVKVIVNDQVDIAMAAGADGVHLGQDDLPPAHARELLGQNAIIGFSTHSVEQAVEAVKLPVDYIAIGPIFETRTKENPDPVVGLNGLSRVRAGVGSFPLVAIGGITDANLSSVYAAGADSAAMISAFFGVDSTIERRYLDLRKISSTV